MQHELSGLRIYRVWSLMHQRCHNPEAEDYCYYGARGISVCSRWNDPINFLADMGHPPAGMTIGRIDNDGNYEPENCRWETMEQQNENTTRNKWLEHDGKQQILKRWAEEYDRDPRRVSERIRRGWAIELALETPTPLGFQAAREKHLAQAKQMWARNGRRYAARSRARRNGDPLPERKPKLKQRLTPEQRDKILELRRQGLSLRAIAATVKASKSSVGYVCADG